MLYAVEADEARLVILKFLFSDCKLDLQGSVGLVEAAAGRSKGWLLRPVTIQPV